MGPPGPPSSPGERVTTVQPFHAAGIDYSDTFTISNSEDNVLRKFYICLFKYTSTRAVHTVLAKEPSALTSLYCTCSD